MPDSILIVEDDSGISTVLADVMEDEGYHATMVADGQAALTALRSGLG